jgi:hypothetical protein
MKKIKNIIKKIKCKLGTHDWIFYDVEGYKNRICSQCFKREQFEHGYWVLKKSK